MGTDNEVVYGVMIMRVVRIQRGSEGLWTVVFGAKVMVQTYREEMGSRGGKAGKGVVISLCDPRVPQPKIEAFRNVRHICPPSY